MRLSPTQKQNILQSLSPYTTLSPAAIYLFGSRVDDQQKGGDIDLLLLTKDSRQAKLLSEQKHYILSAIKGRLGEQKIDLVIRSEADIPTDSFLQAILKKAILL